MSRWSRCAAVTLRGGVNVVLDRASATFNHFSYRADKRAPAQESA
ncbi:hypothetical protein [Cupriavidus basilensis]|nr:hypothetical protein [Cupriavidus basilensis]